MVTDGKKHLVNGIGDQISLNVDEFSYLCVWSLHV